MERWSLRLVAVGLFVIVLVTFITSFDAVSAVAVERGAVSPRLSWAIPLAIDGLIVVASAAAWLESLRSRKWHPFPVALVAVAGALSVAANVAHASGTDLLARILAGVPPVALLSAVELGAWLLRRDTDRDTTRDVATPGVSSGYDALLPGDTSATPDDDEATAPATERIAAALRGELDSGQSLEEINKSALAKLAGVNRATVHKNWGAAVDAVGVSSNGHGA